MHTSTTLDHVDNNGSIDNGIFFDLADINILLVNDNVTSTLCSV